MCQMISRTLKAANPEYEVVEAQDGFSAGQIVATMHPDVVVLDLRMPGMDGFEVCKQIKSQELTRHAVVIAMTAFPSPENEQKIRLCGADAFFSKPLDMDALLNKVKEVV